MTTLYFNPNEIANFSNEISNLFGNLKSNFTKIGQNMNTIANGKWKGTAAQKNLDSLDKAQEALATFINEFSKALAQSVREAKTKISQLETTNLGQSLNISIQEAEKVNIDNLQKVDTTVVEYDYSEIMAISNSLKNIHASISECKQSVPTKIRSFINLDSGKAWRGNAASEFEQTVCSAFSKIDTPIKNLQTCIDNINEAASNAQRADR